MSRQPKSESIAIIPDERIEQKIYLIRGKKVMLSPDLADLYGVVVGQLNQAVKRNIERFPADFMFHLSSQKSDNLKSQIVISRWGGTRHRPYAFTEEGVAMLSAVLRSPTAINVSIQIMRVFVRLRQLLSSHAELRRRMEQIERRMIDHDEKFAAVFDAIRELMGEPKEKRKRPIGYATEARAHPK